MDNLQNSVDELDRMTSEGNEVPIQGKQAHYKKLIEFYFDIANINRITLHNSLIRGNISMSEFTFDITTLKGDKILWNEILRREWKDGLVIHEKYYKA